MSQTKYKQTEVKQAAYAFIIYTEHTIHAVKQPGITARRFIAPEIELEVSAMIVEQGANSFQPQPFDHIPVLDIRMQAQGVICTDF